MSAPAIERTPKAGETWAEFNIRKRREADQAREERTARELFRLALSGLKLDRYVFGVEHGLSEATGKEQVHAYVACKECYAGRAGLVDPRTIVGTSAVTEELPGNEVLAVGANMLNVIKSMMDHERVFHGGRAT